MLISILLYGLLALWIVGAAVILWATLSISEGGYDNIPIAVTMAVLWPILVGLGILSALIEIYRTSKSKRPQKPIDRNTRG
jgi:hypothetical protein